VEPRGGKVLEFLKDNSHLDLEVPDIAFSVKKSEKTVEAALEKLQQKGLVTARRNEYGRVYWYALPSAPITRTYNVADLKTVKEELVSNNKDMDDDAVDLSELQEKSVPKPEKKTRKIGKPADTVAFTAGEDLPKGVTKDVGDDVTFAVREKGKKPSKQIDSPLPDEEPADPVGKSGASPLTIPAIIIVGVISVAALVKGFGVDPKLAALSKTIPKDYATAAELTTLKSEITKFDALDAKIAGLTAKVDSLTTVIDSLKTPPEPLPAPAVAKKKPRKRR